MYGLVGTRRSLITIGTFLLLSLSVKLGDLTEIKNPGSNVTSLLAIPENSTIGTTVLQFMDIYNTSYANFSIVSGNTNKRFAVNPTTQSVYLAGYLDFDVDRQYVLSITWTSEQSNSSTAYAEVRITVQDVEDWPPVYNDTCAFEKTAVDVSDDNHFPFVPWFNIGLIGKNTLLHVAPHSDVKLLDSFCNMEIFTLENPEMKNLFRHIDVVCQKSNGNTVAGREIITIYEDIDTIPQYAMHMKTNDDTDRLLWRIGVTVIDEEFHCFVNATGYKSTYLGRKSSIFLRDPLYVNISAGLYWIGCPDGKYGGRCQYDCICQNGATCHVFNGACKCSPGWRGVACDIGIPSVEIDSHPTILAEVGQFVSLDCNLHNLDESNLFNATWFRDEQTLGSGKQTGIHTYKYNFSRGRYLIHLYIYIKDQHAGKYQCVATDVNGQQYRDEIMIVVVGCPEGYWGDDCDKVCDCQNNGNCSRTLGCVCQAGWNGTKCSEDVGRPQFKFCPDNISTTIEDDRTQVEVTWGLPQATDNSGFFNLTSNFASGDTFPIGSHTVIYKATDNYGNEGRCEFIVIVEAGFAIGKAVVVSLLVVLSSVVFGIGLLLMLFLNRHKILLRYTENRGRKNEGKLKEKRWHGFVAFKTNTEDENFVYDELLPNLENENKYRVITHQRDFIAGKLFSYS
ncbi:uncharacterized protein LOC144444470 isoform X2 [Glandiceps talaboti]